MVPTAIPTPTILSGVVWGGSAPTADRVFRGESNNPNAS